LFVLDRVIEQGWVLVATDYVGLGTLRPHHQVDAPFDFADLAFDFRKGNTHRRTVASQ
jgi:hypothetical protein